MGDLEQEMKAQLLAGNDIAAGLFAIAAQLQTVAVHLKYLGVGDAATTMGAVEYLGTHLGEKLELAGDIIAEAIRSRADNLSPDEEADKRHACLDCGCECSMRSGHYYTAVEAVWADAGAGAKDDLCLDCLEKRLGRPLNEADFIALPHEIGGRMFGQQSGEPSSPELRQRELEEWRAYLRHTSNE